MSSDDGANGLLQSEADHVQHVQRVKENVYLGIQIAGGQILLPILLLTVLFSKRVKRHPVFIDFCISWILSSMIHSLLLYRDRSSDDLLSLNPSYNACLIQASLINGIQAMTSSTNLALVIHLWQLLRQCPASEHGGMGSSARSRKKILFDCALLVTPILVLVAFTVSTMMIGMDPAKGLAVESTIPGSGLSVPTVFYCIIFENGDFTHSLGLVLTILRSVLGFSCSISLITVGFEVSIAILVYRKRTFLNRNAFNWMALFSRIALFSAYRIVAVILNAAIMDRPDILFLVGMADDNLFSGVVDFFNAATPLVAFVVFASEKDIWSVWCFWREEESLTEAKPSLASSENA
ncbi:hypothetical protein ACEPAH_1095 [Sanghuangporus vaninii]